jgi:pSer/pThr/pTyr-binding forkhead associated (FHA) protein
LSSCEHCGQSNSAESRYCVDCGKPLAAATPAARVSGAEPALSKVPATRFFEGPTGPLNRSSKRTTAPNQTLIFSARRSIATARLVVLDETGQPKRSVELDRPAMTIGRAGCDIAFPEDAYLSPRHAEITLRDGTVRVRDLGSLNRTWVFLEEPHRLHDDDVLLIGSQLLRFHRAAGHTDGDTAEDGTRRLGSLAPAADAARLMQLRGDGTTRDIFHLGANGATIIGRDTGDWLFPYDQTMSGRHAELRAEGGAFVIKDLGSRNGVAVAARGELPLRPGMRILVGDQVLRVEQV